MNKNESTQNFLKAMRFEGPNWIPCTVSIMPATWLHYGEAVEAIVLEHPRLFPTYKSGDFRKRQLPPNYHKGRWTDVWGIPWRNVEEGLESIPVDEEAPLRDWSHFENFQPPDPIACDDLLGNRVDWEARAAHVAAVTKQGGLAAGHLTHGFMYMKLFYLRGFANFMMDVADKDPRLDQLIEMICDYNERLVEQWLNIGIEILSVGDDLGMQTALPISPADWRRYLKPSYTRIFSPCREQGVYVRFHSDGHILPIISDLVECGVSILNPQVAANTLAGLEKAAKGKVCIDLDLDRQMFPFATPDQIRDHVGAAVDVLNEPEGGLMLYAECDPDIPLKNVKAICEALEEVGGGPGLVPR